MIDPTIETEIRANSTRMSREDRLETTTGDFAAAHAGKARSADCPGARKSAHVAACMKCDKPTCG